MRRLVRIFGTLLVVAGAATLAWSALVWQWQDPFTYLYTRLEQRELEDRFASRLAAYDPRAAARGGERQGIAAEARRYRVGLRRGEPLGRLRVPRLDLDVVLVNGTDAESLKRGPGRYAGGREDLDELRGRAPEDYLPGEGELVYVAGHRTTYLAPFSRIDTLRRGDRVTLELPYATFEYRISGSRIVPADRLEMLASRGRELLALQACHPRFFATHRFIAYARPVRVTPRGGEPIAFAANRERSDS